MSKILCEEIVEILVFHLDILERMSKSIKHITVNAKIKLEQLVLLTQLCPKLLSFQLIFRHSYRTQDLMTIFFTNPDLVHYNLRASNHRDDESLLVSIVQLDTPIVSLSLFNDWCGITDSQVCAVFH
jgi:hypothetical protein